MTSKELETKLRAEIHDDIRIKEHPKLAGLSNVYWRAEEVCPCPTFDVREEYDPSYRYEFPWDVSAEHNSIKMIEAKVKGVIEFAESGALEELEKAEAKPDLKITFKETNAVITPLNEGNSTV